MSGFKGKTRGPGSARAARGGVLSRPDERNRVTILPKNFDVSKKMPTFMVEYGRARLWRVFEVCL